MKKVLLVLIIIIGGTSCSLLSITDINYAESTRLPVYLNCAKRYGYIEVGGITVNSNIMPDAAENRARKECENQLKEPWKHASEPQTTCYLTFGNKFNKKPDDVIRVLYRCFDSKPPKSPAWGHGKGHKETVRTATQPKAGKEALLKCVRNEAMIIVKEVYINDVAVDTKKHKSLDPYEIEQECYKQWAEVLSSKTGSKKATFCKIKNEPIYGGALKIRFICTVAPNEGKKEKLHPIKSG